MQVRIHTRLMSEASRRRRQELELTLQDINHEPLPGEGTLSGYRQDGGVTFMLPGGLAIHLEQGALERHVAEYRRIIERMVASSRGDGVRSFETLDYSKKLTHDEAGEFIQERLEEEAGIEAPLATCRRLFTLSFLIVTDLPEEMVTQHRTHR